LATALISSKPARRPRAPSDVHPRALESSDVLSDRAPFRGAADIDFSHEARLEGELPSWLAGDLLRTCPAVFQVGEWRALHWFDALGMLFQFRLSAGRVSYRQRLMNSGMRAEVDRGEVRRASFATPSDRGLLSRVLSPVPQTTDNVNVNVVPLGHQRVALTETAHQWAVDPDTLALTELVTYEDELGALSMIAHPHFDFERQKVVSIATRFGRQNQIVVYEHAPSERRRQVIGNIDVRRVPYVHAFGLTPEHAILIGHPFDLNPLSILGSRKGFIEHFAWRPEQGTRLYLLERNSGRVRSHEAPAGFVFHVVNAFEADGSTHIDVVLYPDASIVDHVRTDVLLEKGLPETMPRLVRWSLSPGRAAASEQVLLEHGFEFPIVNYRMKNGQRHRVAYGARVKGSGNATQPPVSAIVRLDLDAGESTFQKPEFVFGEPIFVAPPGSTDERVGVLLAVGSHVREGRSALAILDAQTLELRAWAEVPAPIPLGFHGSFFRA
jgi:carotenoid cleavage dioxygenase-like enzyme